MNRKLNIDDLKEMVKDCVYEEENIVCMNNQYYEKLIKRINNLQSKIDKAIEFCDYSFKNPWYVSEKELLGKIIDILEEDK